MRETVAQFAVRLGKCHDTIQAMCRRGELNRRRAK